MTENNTAVAKLVAVRGNRTTAVLLGWMEDNVYEYLPDGVRQELRKTVMDQINGFKDLAIDVVKSDTAYVNEIWVQKLDEIHEAITRAK